MRSPNIRHLADTRRGRLSVPPVPVDPTGPVPSIRGGRAHWQDKGVPRFTVAGVVLLIIVALFVLCLLSGTRAGAYYPLLKDQAEPDHVWMSHADVSILENYRYVDESGRLWRIGTLLDDYGHEWHVWPSGTDQEAGTQKP